MKRKALFACLVLMLAGLVVVFCARRPDVKVTPALVERIQPGMTESEVAAVLGGPDGDYTGGDYVLFYSDVRVLFFVFNDDDRYAERALRTWTTETGAALVRFENRRVMSAIYSTTAKNMQPRTWLDRIRGWLGFNSGKQLPVGRTIVAPATCPRIARVSAAGAVSR